MEVNGVIIKWLGHASFLIKNHKVIYIDPYELSDKTLEKLPKADIILITHSHYDHCSVEDIKKVIKPGTVIIVTPDSQSKITKIDSDVEMQIMTPWDEIEIKNVKINAVPSYNLNKQYHQKNEGWLGYVIKFENVVIYHAGDTDVIPEMQKLSGYGKQGTNFIALLPVGGTYTMNAEQAAKAASVIKPDIAIPMHFGSIVGSREDAEKFVSFCETIGVKTEILEKE